MALNKGSVSGLAKHEDEEGNGGAGGCRFVLALLVFLSVLVPLPFVVVSGFRTAGAFLHLLLISLCCLGK